MYEIIFWYTGVTIWCGLAVVTAAITLILCIRVCCLAHIRCKNWAMIKMLMKYDVSLDDMDDIRHACDYASYKHGKPFNDKKDCYDWILCVAENYKHRKSLDNKENNNDPNITTG